MSNNKIKHLLDTAYKTDSIAKNKWRIENREQLREQSKKELKELMEKDKTMSNNKQSMKLYTEEEIKRGLDNPVAFDMTTDEFINSLTPIELPSDEEILDLGPFKSTLPYNVVFYDGWLVGATLIRNLIIKKGNNEQQ